MNTVKWTAPEISPGDIVIHYHHRDAQSRGDGRPLQVLRVHDGGRRVEGLIMNESGFIHEPNCTHVDDPDCELRPVLQESMWDYGYWHKKALDQEARITALEALLAAKTSSVTDEEKEELYRQARRMAAEGASQTKIVQATGLHHQTVKRILREQKKLRTQAVTS